jgi:riboflavin synthase
MLMNGRLDGHIVQGHVDQTGEIVGFNENEGSWIIDVQYQPTSDDQITVEKGSICMNGISLTCFNSKSDGFTVAIIPYTYEHTNVHQFKVGTRVNLEFDIIGKYVKRLISSDK